MNPEENKNGEQEEAVENPETKEDISEDVKQDEVPDLREQLKADLAEVGSLKRDLKDALKKAGDKPTQETSSEKPDDNLVEKSYLRSAGISDPEEVELALETSKKWDVSVDALVDDEDFKIKLDKLRGQKANEKATSDVRGGGTKTSTKNKPEYWINKGTPPTKDDNLDPKTRRKINVEFFKANVGGAGKKFYSD